MLLLALRKHMAISGLKHGQIIWSIIAILAAFGGCGLCSKYRGYVARNCTNDTLLMEVTESDTLDDWMNTEWTPYLDHIFPVNYRVLRKY